MKAAAEEDINIRVRRIWLAEALVAFSQGVAFFHAGDEILRSKSLDRDSYNSGLPLLRAISILSLMATITIHRVLGLISKL